jgi:hypothetical protein
VRWLRLWIHLGWFLHQCQTYNRCSTTFISSGCSYVNSPYSVATAVFSQAVGRKTALNSGYLPRGKPQSSSV